MKELFMNQMVDQHLKSFLEDSSWNEKQQRLCKLYGQLEEYVSSSEDASLLLNTYEDSADELEYARYRYLYQKGAEDMIHFLKTFDLI